jgi:hypothetical protein
MVLLAEYVDWWRSAAPSRERNAEEGPVLLGVPALPLFTNLIEGAFSEGGECVLSPPRPFRQSSRPGVRGSRSSGRFVSLLPFALTKARRRTPSEGGPVLLYQAAPQQLP